MTVVAAADGSALGNPGPAGWGWFVDQSHWASGGWPHGTNNMGELTAVLDLLHQTVDLDDDLVVLCDSMYVINSLTKWLPGWKRKGWRKGDGKPVLNVEIMQALDRALTGRQVRFEWVKGHAGHELNEAADRLANGAAQAFQRGGTPDPGPGFGVTGATALVARTVVPAPAPAPAFAAAEPDLFSDAADPAGPAAPPATEENEVIELERSLLTDRVRGRAADIAALLDPDWFEIGRSGRLWSRTEMLQSIAPTPEPVELEVLSVAQVGPDQILLAWRATTGGRSTLRSSLWVRIRGQWRQRFHQGTDES